MLALLAELEPKAAAEALAAKLEPKAIVKALAEQTATIFEA